MLLPSPSACPASPTCPCCCHRCCCVLAPCRLCGQSAVWSGHQLGEWLLNGLGWRVLSFTPFSSCMLRLDSHSISVSRSHAVRDTCHRPVLNPCMSPWRAHALPLSPRPTTMSSCTLDTSSSVHTRCAAAAQAPVCDLCSTVSWAQAPRSPRAQYSTPQPGGMVHGTFSPVGHHVYLLLEEMAAATHARCVAGVHTKGCRLLLWPPAAASTVLHAGSCFGNCFGTCQQHA